MPINIQKFEINKLHQAKNYSIDIRDNKIVMVGVNGLGKTTVVNILYLLLSRQWDRLIEYDFESINVKINNRDYVLKQEIGLKNAEEHSKSLKKLIQEFASHYSTSIRITDSGFAKLVQIGQRGGKDALARELDRALPLPSSACRQIAADFDLSPNSFEKDSFAKIDSLLSEFSDQYQVLYLPTYRRIEKELASIFPNMEGALETYQRRRGTSIIRPGEKRRGYVELVEFGMEDVDETFSRARHQMVQTAKSELTNLAGSYLRDVLRGEGEAYTIETFKKLDDSTIDRILNRPEEQTLPETDKKNLKAVIEKIKSTPANQVSHTDKFAAHFFSKLIDVDKALSEREQLINNFTQVCNKYLTGKKIIYNDKDSTIEIRLEHSNKSLELKSLSSGEKQIVSLFSHLYLRERGDTFVIIDEPELSLSVQWQKQLLPDILETKRCTFLAAVTHSPFIFENNLDEFAIDLEKCIFEAK